MEGAGRLGGHAAVDLRQLEQVLLHGGVSGRGGPFLRHAAEPLGIGHHGLVDDQGALVEDVAVIVVGIGQIQRGHVLLDLPDHAVDADVQQLFPVGDDVAVAAAGDPRAVVAAHAFFVGHHGLGGELAVHQRLLAAILPVGQDVLQQLAAHLRLHDIGVVGAGGEVYRIAVKLVFNKLYAKLREHGGATALFRDGAQQHIVVAHEDADMVQDILQ